MITDEAGGVIARLSYDAFGNRRNAATWSGAPTAGEWSAVAAVTHRGFTFHEHLDHLETIHMNGRVFDPRLGRFLSADPFVQSPDFSQSFNRYSYTFNNPLSYTDPSGYIGGPASGHPDEGPPAVAPEVRPFPSLFPDWNRGELTSRRFGGLGNGLMRMVCNRNPDACDRILRPYHRMANFLGSTVGGLEQGFINAVPGAYYAGQSQLAWGEGRYVLSAGLYAAALGDAALGVVTLGESTALIGSVRAAGTNLTRALRLPNFRRL